MEQADLVIRYGYYRSSHRQHTAQWFDKFCSSHIPQLKIDVD